MKKTIADFIIRGNIICINLQTGKKVIDHEHLTIGQDFDIVLIRALDKITSRNRIDKLSLKSVEISGEIESGALSSMILKTVAQALKI